MVRVGICTPHIVSLSASILLRAMPGPVHSDSLLKATKNPLPALRLVSPDSSFRLTSTIEKAALVRPACVYLFRQRTIL